MTTSSGADRTVNGDHAEKAGVDSLARIDRHYVSHELFHLFHLEKGFLFNFKELLVRPAASIREFLFVNRSRHMKPIAYLIFSALLYTFIYNYLKPPRPSVVEESYFHGSSVETIQHWLDAHFGYTYIIKSFFVAFVVRLLFRKYQLNIFEIMTMMCFISAQGLWIIAFLLPLHPLLTQTANNIILIGASVLYPVIVIAQVFDRSKPLNYLKALIGYFVGNTLVFLIVVASGLMIDWLAKLL